MIAAMTAAEGTGLRFNALLTPHRSLSRAGFLILMGVMSLICFTGGVLFWAIGAWPVMGFLGLDLLLIWGAFKLNYRAAQIAETVQLSPDELLVRRFAPKRPVQSWSFQPYWVRVHVPDPEQPEQQVQIASHGRRLVVGAFLSPFERAEFATALDDALQRCRRETA